ncbi:MAG: hypothetical protein ACLQQB_12615 [Solirubrobacteraceae bacterium]|jgi:hypothetical protein
MRRALAALIAAAALLLLPACASLSVNTALAAGESEQASLHAAFSPDRLGQSTTISYGFHLQTSEGLAPPPLQSIVLHMPAGMNYTLTTLGLAICQPAVLQAKGVNSCPPNSRLGSGNALVEVPFGTGAGHEIPEIQAVVGPPHNGNMVVLFYANGQSPVSAQLVFQGEVLPDSGVFGSQLATTVPLVTSVPGGPDVSIVNVNATIGPSGLTYYKHVHGKLEPFHPLGIGVPEHCPRGGFPFNATFSFQDGSTASASTTVPCPPSVPAHRRHK